VGCHAHERAISLIGGRTVFDDAGARPRHERPAGATLR
jgi:hypothetical protein